MTLRHLVEELRDVTERRATYPVGTVRSWGGKQFQKQRNGQWTYYAGTGKKPAPKAAAPTKPAPAKAAASEPEPEKKPEKKGIRGALGKAWHTLTEPFVGAFHLATKKEARKEFKKKIGGAIKKEAAETKEMFGILKKALTPGKKVSKEERARAINQVADLVKVGLIGTMYGHLAAQGIGELLSVVASPVEEIAGVIIDKPLRKITKKVFGHEHGILPSGFYGGEGEKKEWVEELMVLIEDVPEEGLLDRIIDAVLDELAKEGISEDDIEDGLIKSGLDADKAAKLATKLSGQKSESLRSLVDRLGVTIDEDFRPGTIRHWKTGDVIKMPNGTWSPYSPQTRGPVPGKQAAPMSAHPQFAGSDKHTEHLHKEGGQWSPERQELHQEYIRDSIENVPKSSEPTVYMTGGGPAAGKSKALLANPKVGIPGKDKAVHADPDGAKEWIPEFNENKHSDDTSVATRVHEESAYMSQEAIKNGLSNSRDIVYDSSGDGGIAKLAAKVQKIRDQGAKKVVAHYATVDVDEAIRRSDARAKVEGRFVPHAYLRQVHKDVTRTALAAIEQGVYDSLDLWDTSTGADPVHVASYTKDGGLKVHDPTAWEAFKKRGE